MRLPSRRLLLELHGGAGALFGVLLFVLLFSGSWTLAHEALQEWARPPAMSLREEPLPVARLLEVARDQGIGLDDVSILLPGAGQSGVTFCEPRGGCRLTLDRFTGQPLPSFASLDILKDLHKSFFIGFPGRVLVSLFGIVLLILCVAGLLLHSRRWRDLLRWRRNRGLRLSLFDLHGLIGMWAFPWLLMFAVTGAFSGLGALGTLLLSPVAYPQAPRQAFIDLLGAPPPAASGQSAIYSIDIDRLLADDARRAPDFTVQQLKFSHWGDREASVELGGVRHGLPSTVNFERHLYRLADGRLLVASSSAHQGFWTRAFIAIQPLHFGQYLWLGSGWAASLRGLHLGMGLAACLLCASGLFLWGQRRAANPRWNAVLLPRMAEGVCGGLTVAAASLLLSLQALPPQLRAGSWPGWLLWGVWAGSLLLAVVPPRPWRPLPILLALAGLACVLAVGLHLYAWLAIGQWPPLVADLSLLVCALLLCRPTWWLTRAPVARRHPLPCLTEDPHA